MRICVVMPAYNEESGISGFVDELTDSLLEWNPSFVVVNDCSKDRTADVVREIADRGVSIEVVTNAVNSGHGPSTVNALHLGLASGADRVVAIDGDGQFLGADVAVVVKRSFEADCDIVEGNRRHRGDPVYRRVVSTATRLLVLARSGRLPADANTPLRVYRPEVLRRHLEVLRRETSIPNLLISARSRRWRLAIEVVDVRSIPRRGSDQASITWGKGRRQLPTKRFVKFCARAVRDFVVG